MVLRLFYNSFSKLAIKKLYFAKNFMYLLTFLTNSVIPVMLRIAAFHFLADFNPGSIPEICKVICDLERPACWRKKFQKDGNATNPWGFKTSENLLNYDFK